MSQAPTEATDSDATKQYAQAWTDTLNLVRDGSSWSGRERNCVYLNVGQTSGNAVARFADVSAVSGLDFADDARALAVVDGDHDGDLDLWLRNRTGPRLRLMQNHTNDGKGASFVSVKLRGTKGHPDAIGAVATFMGDSDKLPVTQSVRCGDAFISQSSQRLHFGLKGNSKGIIKVVWPGGKSESFADLRANKHYVLKEGTGIANEISLPPLKSTDPATPLPIQELEPTAAARIVLPAKLPFPAIHWLDSQGASTKSPVDHSASASLVVLWTNTCPVCRKEIASFRDRSGLLESKKLNVVGINVDSLMVESPAPQTAARISTTPPQLRMQIDGASIARIKALQNAIFDKHPPFTVPQSYLVDRQGTIVAMYRGEVNLETVFADMKLATENNVTKRSAGLPVSGDWFTKPATDSEFIENVAKRIVLVDMQQGISYFAAAIASAATPTRKAKLQSEYVSRVRKFAGVAASKRDFASAQRLLHQALPFADAHSKPSLHHDRGVLYATEMKYGEAERQFIAALMLRPDYPSAKKKLSLVRRKRSAIGSPVIPASTR